MSLLSIASDTAALFLAWLFLSAAVHKLKPANQSYYQGIVSSYGLGGGLGGGLGSIAHGNYLTIFIGCVEAIVAILIVLPFSRMPAAVLLAALLLMYALLMLMQLWQGKKDIACGCAGPLSDSTISPALIVRNLLLLGIALFCASWTGSLLGHGPALLFILPTALLASIIYNSSEQLISNAQKLGALRAHGH